MGSGAGGPATRNWYAGAETGVGGWAAGVGAMVGWVEGGLVAVGRLGFVGAGEATASVGTMAASVAVSPGIGVGIIATMVAAVVAVGGELVGGRVAWTASVLDGDAG